MSIATDVKTYADTALAQGKSALAQASTIVASANKRLVADAPKPAYAALGVADLVAATVSKRVESLPADAAQNVGKAQQTSRTLLTRTQDDALGRLAELRGRLDAGLESVTALPTVAKNTTEAYVDTAKAATEAYLSTAKDLYGKLTVRGEAKATELRKDRRVSKLLGQVGDAADAVQGTVSPVVRSAFDAVQSVSPIDVKPARKSPVTATKPTARKSPAKTAPAKTAPAKSTATKTAPAKKSTPAKRTATKSTAAKSTARKSTATKSTAAKA